MTTVCLLYYRKFSVFWNKWMQHPGNQQSCARLHQQRLIDIVCNVLGHSVDFKAISLWGWNMEGIHIRDNDSRHFACNEHRQIAHLQTFSMGFIYRSNNCYTVTLCNILFPLTLPMWKGPGSITSFSQMKVFTIFSFFIFNSTAENSVKFWWRKTFFICKIFHRK